MNKQASISILLTTILCLFFASFQCITYRLKSVKKHARTAQGDFFIKTSEGTVTSINKKDLSHAGLLKRVVPFLQKCKNIKKPLKLKCSYDNFQKFITALQNIHSVDTTTQDDTLLEMASRFKSLKLYSLLLNNSILPSDIKNYSTRLWMQLEYNSCSDFYQKLMNQCIRFNTKQTPWTIPTPTETNFLEQTHDKKYYINSISYNLINIYDESQKLVRTFENKYKFTLFKHKNIVLLHPSQVHNGDRNIQLYDIDTDTVYTLLEDTYSQETIISPDENYIATINNQNCVILWNIADCGAITRWEKNYDPLDSLAFSSDSTLLAASPEYEHTTLRLWALDTENNKLKELATYNQCIPGKVHFIDDNKHLIISYYGRHIGFKYLNLKLDSINDDTYLLTECINLPDDHYDIFCCQELTKNIYPEKYTIYANRENKTVTITTPAGDIIHTTHNMEPWRIAISQDKQHIAISHSGSLLTIFNIVENSDDNNMLHVECHTTKALVHTDFAFNSQGSLLARMRNGTTDVHDLKGNLIKSFTSVNQKEPWFLHPSGYSILGDGIKHELYNPTIEKRVNDVARNITLCDYLLLRKIITHKEKPLTLKSDYFYSTIFDQAQPETQQLCWEHLKVTKS